MKEDIDWRDTKQFYRADTPCQVCGGLWRTGMEPRFLYVVCEDHQNTRPVDVPQKVNRHGKPAKAFTERLRAPTSDDYGRMVEACVRAMMDGSTDVLGLFPYTLKFPKDFPKGILEVKYEDGTNVHRMKAPKLLKWLRENGHTDITSEMLRVQAIALGKITTKLEEMFDNSVGDDLQ